MAATSTDIRARLADEIWRSDTESQAPRPGMWHDLNVNWQMYYLDRADRLLSLPGIAITDTEAAVTLRIRDGSWELTFSNGRTASAPVGHPAALLTAHLAEGDQVTFAAAAAEAQEEQP